MGSKVVVFDPKLLSCPGLYRVKNCTSLYQFFIQFYQKKFESAHLSLRGRKYTFEKSRHLYSHVQLQFWSTINRSNMHLCSTFGLQIDWVKGVFSIHIKRMKMDWINHFFGPKCILLHFRMRIYFDPLRESNFGCNILCPNSMTAELQQLKMELYFEP